MGYCGNAWYTAGETDSNGEAYIELLPSSYCFRMHFANGVQYKTQNIGTDPEVIFQTVRAVITLKDTIGAPVPGGAVYYIGYEWLFIGTTDSNGEVTKELLPVSFTFKMNYGGTSRFLGQNLSESSTVEFLA